MPDWKNIKIFLFSLAILCNTIIGIGIFALPYMSVTVGLPLAVVYFLVLGSLVLVVHLMFSEVALHTADYRRLPGFAKIYLGEWAQILAGISNMIGFFGILLAFMVIGGQFLYELFHPVWGLAESTYSLIYFFAGSILIFFGINLVSRVGLLGLVLFFAIMVTLAIQGMPLFSMSNLSARIGSGADIFLPYGAILFAFWASSSIPEVEEMLGRHDKKKFLKPVIITASVIALVTYLLFIFVTVGITGANTNESALIGLKEVMGDGAVSLLFLFGLVISFCSFLIVGLTLKKILAYDLHFPKAVAWGLVTLIPVALFLSGFKNFIAIFSFVGGVLLAVDGILILLMYQKVRPSSKFLTYPLLAVFIAGILFEIFYHFN